MIMESWEQGEGGEGGGISYTIPRLLSYTI